MKNPLLQDACRLAVLLLVLLSPAAVTAEAPAGASAQEKAEKAVQSDDDSPVLATYRRTISQRRLDDWLEHGEPSSKDPASALEELILVESLAEEALRRGLDQTPRARVELARLEIQLARPLVKKGLEAAIDFSDEEVEEKYLEIGHRYGLPRRVRVRNLYRRYPPAAGEAEKAAVRETIEALRERARAGEDFAQLASRYSQSTTRVRGGLMGNVRPGQLSPALDRVVQGLEKGQVSDVLSGPDGLTILYCEDILPPVERSPEHKRKSVRDYMASYAYEESRRALHARLLERIDVRSPSAAHGDPGHGNTAVIATAGSEEWTMADVAALIGITAEDLREWPRDRLETRLEIFLIGRMMVQELPRLESSALEHYRARQPWKRLQWLAREALASLVQDSLVRPSETELKAYFEANVDSFTQPEQFHVSVIAVGPDESAADDASAGSAAVLRQAGELRDRIASGELSFEQAARQYSKHPSAADGGDAGWLSRRSMPGQLGLDVLRTVLNLEAGEISEPIDEGGLLWLVRLVGREAARPASFEEARHQIDRQLGQQRVEQIKVHVLERWRERLGIEWLSSDGSDSP